MVTTPQILGPDNVLRSELTFSTTIPFQFYEGKMDADTVDMQISIRGSAFTSDPDLILFEGDTFSFPNPSVYPDGLDLVNGLNVIEVRSISFSGAVSTPARLEVTLVDESSVNFVGEPPTQFFVEQRQDSVLLRVAGPTASQFQGINFYASRFSGGGQAGYQRINLNVIRDFELLEQTQAISSLTSQSPVALNNDGTPAADPLYVKVQQIQSNTSNTNPTFDQKAFPDPLSEEELAALSQNAIDENFQTDFVDVAEVPESTTVIQTTIQVDSLVSVPFYSFDHHRQFGTLSTPPTIPVAEFLTTPATETLFYVATAVYFDPVTQLQTESSFSIEVTAKPVFINDTVGTFPSPSRLDIVESTLNSLIRTTPQLSVQPGSVIRDTFVDPLANEVSKLRLLADFMYRIQGFDTLLQIDGIDIDGSSTPVSQSPYKQALQQVFSLANALQVQTIINQAFEQLASRNNVFRKAGTRARGFVTFFTRTQPLATITIPLGTRVASGSVEFVTVTDSAISFSNIGSFFNPATQLYEIDVTVEAVDSGETGNVGAGQINRITTPIPNLFVTNSSATFGGQEGETNLDLSIRARDALASVDSGTEQGVRQAAAAIAGVVDVQTVISEDPYMQRDYDSDFQKHVGGKVDVWVRGDALSTVTDTFAIDFEVARDIQFVPIGNPANLVFRALDAELSPTKPIAEMLQDFLLGLGLRNATTGSFFDVTGALITDFRTIQLDNSIPQPTVGAGQIVFGDYRYQSSSQFVFSRQPVDTVVSVEGTLSGVLPDANFDFVQTDDPLQKGRSVKSSDALQINSLNGIPSTAFVEVTGEAHPLVGVNPQFLNNLGANPLTIQVFNSNRSILYRSPADPTGPSDYIIIPGNATTPVSIQRTENSRITNGQTVGVDYSHTENFTVTYTQNFIVESTQNALDAQKHLTADILCKEALRVPVDITATIIHEPGINRANLDSTLRTELLSFLQDLPQGSSVRQSDIIAVIDNTVGVQYVVTPLTKLGRTALSQVVYELIPTSSSTQAQPIQGNSYAPYTTDTVRTWLLTDELENPTSDAGGPTTQFRQVYQDDLALVMLDSNPQAISNAPNQAYIIGSEGLSIVDYSDDSTIIANNPAANTEAEIEEIRRQLTANRVLVTLPLDERPELYEYRCTYIVADVAEITNNLDGSPLEYFDAGNFVLTLVEG